MTGSLNFLPHLLAAATTSPANLSEAELLTRYPAIAAAGALVFLLGLVADAYLVFRLARSPGPRLRIDTKPWGLRDLLLATATVIVVFTVVDLTAVLGLQFAHFDEELSLPWVLAVETLLRLGVLVGFIEFFRQRRIDGPAALGLRLTPPLRAIAGGALGFFATLPPLVVAFVLYAKLCRVVGIQESPQPIADLLATSDSAAVIAIIIALAIAVAPVSEELFFRGFAYPVLKQRWGAWKALTAVSAIFAVIHLHVPSIGPLFALAFGLGLSYELTGSLLAPITMHALFNGANVAMLLYVRSQL